MTCDKCCGVAVNGICQECGREAVWSGHPGAPSSSVAWVFRRGTDVLLSKILDKLYAQEKD